MSSYAVFFGYNKDKNVFRLPTNPEQIEISSTQAIEKYEILKLGQIAVPGELELKEYSFECEFPRDERFYIETHSNFKNADWYLSRFEFWRNKKVPFRFIAGRTDDGTKDTMDYDSINTLCLIEELTITEKAGEEGDKYVSFKLLEYREFSKQPGTIKIVKKKAKKTKKSSKETPKASPKSNGYHIVKSGESLWTIAKKYYGNGARNNIIYSANKSKIKNPNMLTVGQKLKIPSESEFSKYSAALPKMKTEKAEKAGAKKTYTYLSDKPIAGISLSLENGKYTHTYISGEPLAGIFY